MAFKVPRDFKEEHGPEVAATATTETTESPVVESNAVTRTIGKVSTKTWIAIAVAAAGALGVYAWNNKAPTGFGTLRKAQACALDPSLFKDLEAECKDEPAFVNKVLAAPACKLPSGDTELTYDGKPSTVAQQAAIGVARACDGEK
jgi:hypothetical protein